jgi:hypothetical protein
LGELERNDMAGLENVRGRGGKEGRKKAGRKEGRGLASRVKWDKTQEVQVLT